MRMPASARISPKSRWIATPARCVFDACSACSRLNPKTAHAQMIGGMTWGIGSALMEENMVDQRFGSFINQDLASYDVAVNASA
jgi:xanthine dehydrogenase YagR molybdenum-binding subunit